MNDILEIITLLLACVGFYCAGRLHALREIHYQRTDVTPGLPL